MAYERHEWVCGETVTEQKMNNIEDGIEEALECCGGIDVGYSCTEIDDTIFDGTVTTYGGGSSGNLAYEGNTLTFGHPTTLKITFEGTEYQCPVRYEYGDGRCGADSPFDIDQSEYPFFLGFTPSQSGFTIYTETTGTYSVIIEGATIEVTVSPCFEAAVRKILNQV